MKLNEILVERIKPRVLFIGLTDDARVSFSSLKDSLIIDWSELIFKDGKIFVLDIPLKDFSFVFIGAIGDTYNELASALKAYIDFYKVPNLFYGATREKNNKILQTVLLQQSSLSQVKTVIASHNTTTASSLVKQLKLPLVSKIVNGSQGREVRKHDTEADVENRLHENEKEFYIFQEFIPNDGDLRIFFLKRKMLYAIIRKRNSENEFRNNVSLGGTQEFIKLEQDVKKLAEDACKVMNFDVSGVDLIQHNVTKKWFVLEINAAPQFFGPEHDDVIVAFKKYILQR